MYDTINPERLWSTYDHVFRVVRKGLEREEAEDLAMDVIYKALKALPRFRGDMDDLHHWIARIAQRVWIDYTYRRKILEKDWDEKVVGQLHSYEPDPLDAVILHERNKSLFSSVQSLTEKQQGVIYARFIGGFTLQATSIHLGMSINVIKSLQWRGLAKLSDTWSE